MIPIMIITSAESHQLAWLRPEASFACRAAPRPVEEGRGAMPHETRPRENLVGVTLVFA